MIFDFGMIKAFYKELPLRISETRKNLKRPLTLSEKILYTHLFDKHQNTAFDRGVDYVDFAPDRVAMQDATAQMALLQFMMAGKNQTWRHEQEPGVEPRFSGNFSGSGRRADSCRHARRESCAAVEGRNAERLAHVTLLPLLRISRNAQCPPS